MEFTKSLIKGKLIKRYKRFFVDVKINKEVVTAHCPNTGSMKGLLDEGNEVFLLKNDNPKRKLKYGLELIKANNNLVGVNTHMANKIVEHGLNTNLINELKNNDSIKSEVFYNKGYKSYLIFLVQIQNMENFKIAKDIDEEYYKNYLIAKKAGVNFLAYRCKLNSKEIRIEKKLKIINE
jgi:sugar fermentation stimulation protein A